MSQIKVEFEYPVTNECFLASIQREAGAAIAQKVFACMEHEVRKVAREAIERAVGGDLVFEVPNHPHVAEARVNLYEAIRKALNQQIKKVPPNG